MVLFEKYEIKRIIIAAMIKIIAEKRIEI